ARVAKATDRKAVPVYEARGFRGAKTVGALVALARNALWEEFGREVEPLGLNATQAAVMIALATQVRTAADLSRTLAHDAGAMTAGRRPARGNGPRAPRAARAGLPPTARRAHG